MVSDIAIQPQGGRKYGNNVQLLSLLSQSLTWV